MNSIRPLTPADWQRWKALRLEALQNAPEAFGSSYEEEATWTEAEIRERIGSVVIFGSFEGEQLVGSLALLPYTGIKERHKGFVWGMYVQPAYRGQGRADELMRHLLAYAILTPLEQLTLHCTTTQVAAAKLYQKHGFTIYGTAPRYTVVEGVGYDSYLMVKMLR